MGTKCQDEKKKEMGWKKNASTISDWGTRGEKILKLLKRGEELPYSLEIRRHWKKV